jgi:pimeloyl-ACP methyl ester carboxylesterase
VERLILLNSAYTKIPLSIRLGSFRFLPRLIRRVPLSFVKASARRTFYDHTLITNDWLEDAYRYINEPGALRAMFSIIRSNISLSGLKRSIADVFMKEINRLTIPALILYGKKDKIVPNINSRLLHQHLLSSECVPFEDCGHELQVEHCSKFCKQTVRFLLKHEG